jgi:hypothetical protein
VERGGYNILYLSRIRRVYQSVPKHLILFDFAKDLLASHIRDVSSLERIHLLSHPTPRCLGFSVLDVVVFGLEAAAKARCPFTRNIGFANTSLRSFARMDGLLVDASSYCNHVSHSSKFRDLYL